MFQTFTQMIRKDLPHERVKSLTQSENLDMKREEMRPKPVRQQIL
jgi:hypothetical protein